MERWDTPVFPIYANTNFCAKSAERQSSSYLHVWYWYHSVAEGSDANFCCYFFYIPYNRKFSRGLIFVDR